MEIKTPEPPHEPARQAQPEQLSPSANTHNGKSTIAGAAPVSHRPSRRLYWAGAVLAIAAALTFLALRAMPKSAQTSRGATATTVSVPVARVTREDVYNELTIPAEFRPYQEDELHAKISGFLTNITVDFGDQVKAGQLLAELEVPELEDQLDRAKANLEKAVADHTDAHLAYSRLQAVEKEHRNLVAQQDLDTAHAKDLSTDAAIAAAKAEVEQYQTMVAYTRITAPFAGVITRRYVDQGALIQAGISSSSQSLPLVRISDNYRLRLDFPVSVLYVKDIKTGDPVEVRVDSLVGKSFTGMISRFTRKVDEDTRTMMTEIEVANPDLELVPGMYANVVLKVGRHAQALTVPTEAISADRKGGVYVVNDRNELEERHLTLGLETPTRYEVLQGLKEGEFVVTGGRSQLAPGQKVIPKLDASLAMK